MSKQSNAIFTSRRYFFFGLLAAASSCRKSARYRTYPVSILRASSYSEDLESLVRRLLIEHRVSIRGQERSSKT